MPKKKMPNFFINVFYESKFKDSVFVVKASGKVIEDDQARDHLMKDIKNLTIHGIKVLLVYGGGRAIDEGLEKKGITVQKHDGRRITNAETFEVMKEVIGGQLALKVYNSMAINDLEGLSLNAVPSEWMNVHLRPKKPVDFGFVGDIHATYARPVNRLFKAADFIAVPCLTWAEDGTLCNINADTIATALASAMKANKLIFMSDVDGVKIKDETAFIITDQQIDGYIADGTAYGGMKVKLENCKRALGAGVKRIHVINGLREHALSKEIFEPIGPGTMLIMESERQNYMNEVEAQKVLEGQKK